MNCTNDEQTIYDAIRYNKINKFKKLINEQSSSMVQRTINVNNMNMTVNGADLLILTVQFKRILFVKYLIDLGINLNPFDRTTPLCFAINSHNLEMVKLLLSAGADPNLTVGMSCPINITIYKGQHSILEELIKFGVNINTSPKGRPVTIAAMHNDQIAVDILIKAGADINSTYPALDNSRCSPNLNSQPLFYCGHDDGVLFRQLIAAGANVNCQDIYGNTPLHTTIKQYNYRTVKLLLDYGANIHIRNKEGKTPEDIKVCEIEYLMDDYLATIDVIINHVNKEEIKEPDHLL